MLQSMLLRGDPQLEACATHDAAHLTPGSSGAAVGQLHLVLLTLGAPAIDTAELRSHRYGPSTAAAVLAYKQARNVVNRSYQQQADNIVGRMTLAQMDRELVALERLRPRQPWRRDALADSAPAFAVRAALINAMAQGPAGGPTQRWAIGAEPGSAVGIETGPATELADTLLQTSAATARRVMRTMGAVRRGPRQSVTAEPGLWRDTICKTALAAPVQGKRFDEPPVSSCWGRVRRADNRRLPVDAPPPPVKTAWCGIFATWLWWLAGHEVVWIDGIGPAHAGSLRRLKTSTLFRFLAPGDIIVENFGHLHHMLVLEIDCDRATAKILEGNGGDAPAHLTKVKRRTLNLPTTGARHWFYSVDTLRDPNINYGYNSPEAVAPPAKSKA